MASSFRWFIPVIWTLLFYGNAIKNTNICDDLPGKARQNTWFFFTPGVRVGFIFLYVARFPPGHL
jgi:tryptophan-rich sensory protein